MLIHPLHILHDPEYWRVGRKPLGEDIELIDNHPLRDALYTAIFITQSAGNVPNLADRSNYFSLTSKAYFSSNVRGRCMQIDSTGQYEGHGLLHSGPEPVTRYAYPKSTLILFHPTAFSSTYRRFGYSWSRYLNCDATWHATFQNAGSVTINPLGQNRYTSFGFTELGGGTTNGKFYVDGVYDSTYDRGADYGPFGAVQYLGGHPGAGSTYGSYYALLQWQYRELTDDDFFLLHEEPWTLIRPRVPKQYFDVGAAGTIKSIASTIPITTTTSGVLSRLTSLAGTIPTSFSMSGVVSELRAFAGTSTISFTMTGALSVGAFISLQGSIPITTTLTGDIRRLQAFAGNVPIVLDLSALISETKIFATTIPAATTFGASLSLESENVPNLWPSQEAIRLSEFVPEEFTPEGHRWLQEQNREVRELIMQLVFGNPILPIEYIYVNPTEQIYPLGSKAHFKHDLYGMIDAVFCKYSGMVGTVAGNPVGFLSAAGSHNWTVTNDFSASNTKHIVGISATPIVPADNTYGWVIQRGTNLRRINIRAGETNNSGDEVGWSGDGEVSSDAAATAGLRIFARQTVAGSRTSAVGYAAGELYIDV